MIKGMDMVNFSGKKLLFLNIRNDGRKYFGNWMEGKQHGQGTFYSDDGEGREGYWMEGVLKHWK